MKMPSPHLNIPRKTSRALLPALALAGALALFFGHAMLPSPVAGFGHFILTPVWQVRDALSISFGATLQSLASRRVLVAENNALRTALASKERESVLSRVLAHENERLRALVGRGTPEKGFISATILQSVAFAPFDTCVIDVGAEEGVRADMMVRTPEGYALGVVMRVLAHTSIVSLFTASGMQTDALLNGTTTLRVQLLGQGAGTMRMELPRDILVQEGTAVTLPDMLGSTIGFVTHVELGREDAYQTVYAAPPANMHTVRFVVVDTIHLFKPPEETLLVPVPIVASTTAPTGVQ